MSTPRSIAIALLVVGAVGGAAVVEYWRSSSLPAEAQGGTAVPSRLDADINQLKGTVPSQSHAMADVAYHWNNLWFAAQKQNWPLAQFYFDESRSHMLWTIRIRPVRKAPDGQPVDLNSIFESIDTSTLTPVKTAIEQKDLARFTAAYKQALESCYSCHKASGKPYLRPIVPQSPMQSIINFDPDAAWPK
jgi:hypothetical protein